MNATEILEKNKRKANDSGTWDHSLTNRAIRLLSIMQYEDRPMMSPKVMANKYNIDREKMGRSFATLKEYGLIEKFNSNQWMLTDKGESYEPSR